jgi:AbrB family transcriptional regulator, transcriptional pleiotropic regulator of transition state genes
MKSTGIVRRIDGLGRIVMPKELRMALNINAQDQLEFFVNDAEIIVRKRKDACELCDSMNDVLTFESHSVCCGCMKRMAARLKE